MWGGTRVSGSDIDFIQKWIDDGCPADDQEHDHDVEVCEDGTLARCSGDAAHPCCEGPPNDYFEEAGGIKTRKNVRCLSEVELQRYRDALRDMNSYNQYYYDERSFDFWARIHANSCQHGWEEFLPWHRVYLYEFEQRLQDINPTITIPYWEWSYYDANVDISIEDSKDPDGLDNGIIPAAFRCWVDEEALRKLTDGGQVPKAVLTKLKRVLGKDFNSGNRLFVKAGIQYGADPASDKAIMDQLRDTNPMWFEYRWPGGNSSLLLNTYPRAEDIQRMLKIDNFFTFGSGPDNNHFFGALESVHNLLHNFSGGINPHHDTNAADTLDDPAYGYMVDAGRTAFDPIFWSHHSNVDRLWAEWQSRHPNQGPSNPNSVLPPWSLTVSQTAETQTFGYEYMKSTLLYPTAKNHPIKKFRSESGNVPEYVLKKHNRAEVRLHNARYMATGAMIRVFINQPDADENTGIENNPHFAGQLHTFNGACVGGPGHCAPPSKHRRAFDIRKRSHKTPGNYRVDATETVRKLAEKGASDFDVTLVVMGLDGKARDNALQMEGVSLNFLD